MCIFALPQTDDSVDDIDTELGMAALDLISGLICGFGASFEVLAQPTNFLNALVQCMQVRCGVCFLVRVDMCVCLPAYVALSLFMRKGWTRGESASPLFSTPPLLLSCSGAP